MERVGTDSCTEKTCPYSHLHCAPKKLDHQTYGGNFVIS